MGAREVGGYAGEGPVDIAGAGPRPIVSDIAGEDWVSMGRGPVVTDYGQVADTIVMRPFHWNEQPMASSSGVAGTGPFGWNGQVWPSAATSWDEGQQQSISTGHPPSEYWSGQQSTDGTQQDEHF